MCHSAANTKVSALQRLGLLGRQSQLPNTRTALWQSAPGGAGAQSPRSPRGSSCSHRPPPALCLGLQPLPRTTRVPVPTGCVEVGKVRGRSAGGSGDPKGPVAASSPRLGGGSAGGAGPGAGPTARSVPPHAPPRPDSERLGGRGRE